MSTSHIEDPRQLVSRLDVLSLRRITTIESEDYRADIIDAARQELQRRGLELQSTQQFLQSLGKEQLHGTDMFCQDCYNATSDERFPATGDTFFRRLMPTRDPPCPRCGSVLREYHVSVFFLPLSRICTYRVKEHTVPWPGQPKILSSRKLCESRTTALASDQDASSSSAQQQSNGPAAANSESRSRSRWVD